MNKFKRGDITKIKGHSGSLYFVTVEKENYRLCPLFSSLSEGSFTVPQSYIDISDELVTNILREENE